MSNRSFAFNRIVHLRLHNPHLYIFLFLNFLTFTDHLHIFVGQSSPSCSSNVCFQLSAVSSYVFVSSRLLSIHLRLGRPYHSSRVQPCPSFFLKGCRLLFSGCVRTNLIFSMSRMLTFGILCHPLVCPDV